MTFWKRQSTEIVSSFSSLFLLCFSETADALFLSFLYRSFSCGSAGKESACNVRDLGSIPGFGRSSEEGKGYPLQYSGLENSMDYVAWGHKSWTQLSNFHLTSFMQISYSTTLWTISISNKKAIWFLYFGHFFLMDLSPQKYIIFGS